MPNSKMTDSWLVQSLIISQYLSYQTNDKHMYTPYKEAILGVLYGTTLRPKVNLTV